MIEQRWGLMKGLMKNLQSSNEKDKEDGDEEEGSEDGFSESQKEVEKGTPLFVSYQNNSFILCFMNFISLVLMCLYCVNRKNQKIEMKIELESLKRKLCKEYIEAGVKSRQVDRIY